MTRKSAVLWLLALIGAPSSLLALGLGEIKLNSALNQPFDAEIELVSVAPGELDSLEAKIASQETFNRYGLDRPFYLTNFRFRVERNPAGQMILRVRSTQSVTEPFVTILVEANWSRGRLLREYTVLLDPPTYLPESESAAPEPVAAPATRTQTQQSGTILRTPPPPQQQARPAPAPAPAPSPTITPRPIQAQPSGRTPLPAATGEGEYRVQRGDTLWAIASTMSTGSRTDLNTVMMAIYRSNPSAFYGNINRLKAGVVLNLPDRASMASLAGGNVNAEVARQITEWRSGTPGTTTADSGATLQLTAPSDSSLSLGTATADAETLQRLSDAQEEIDRLQYENADLQTQLEDSERIISVKDQQLAELQQRLADMDAPTDTQAGLDTLPADDSLIADDTGMPDDVLSDTGIMDDTGVTDPLADTAPDLDTTPADTAVSDTQAETAPTAPVSRPEPPKSMMDSMMEALLSPGALIFAGVVAILLFAVIFFFRRKEEDDLTGTWEALSEEEDDETRLKGTGTARSRSPVQDEAMIVEEGIGGDTDVGLESGVDFDLGAGMEAEAEPTAEEEIPADATNMMPGPDFTASDAAQDVMIDTAAPLTGVDTGAYPKPEDVSLDDTISSETQITLDQSDPLAEADFHMAYGLYDQAADLVKAAADKEPARRELRMKLLEIYFVWGNKEAFLETATQLHESRDDAHEGEWDKILIMGKQICPDEALFAAEPGAAAGGGDIDLDLETSGDAAASIDLLTDEGGDAVDLDFGDEAVAEDEPLLQEPAATGEVEALDFELEDPAASETPDIELAPTVETPTIEATGLEGESPTMESETLDISVLDEDASAATMETPTIEARIEDAAEKQDLPRGDETAELDVDDLGLDVDSLAATGSHEMGGLDDDLEATNEQPAMSADDAPTTMAAALDENTIEQLAATELAGDDAPTTIGKTLTVEDLASLDEERTMEATVALEPDDLPDQGTGTIALDEQFGDTDVDLKPVVDAGATAEVTIVDEDDFGTGTEVLDNPPDFESPDPGDSIDLDLDDLTAALDTAQTVEQPGPKPDDAFSSEVFSGSTNGAGEDAVDLDVGDALLLGDEEPTGTEKIPHDELALPDAEEETLSEVGTKLDLARAYMDMGDPDGARNILQEVMDEGNDNQREQAQRLIDGLP